MPIEKAPPLSLYIHIPWCLKKCPYCDFNSHQKKDDLPEQAYIETLLRDLDNHLPAIADRPIVSIFIGGGTPSLFHGTSFAYLLKKIRERLTFSQPDIEITLEANPGTFEIQRFCDFKAAGINRLSIGVQSFQDDKLKTLGRVHAASEARAAITGAQTAGFERINIDLMHGLPQQSIADALFDLQSALDFGVNHISWYELTLEPNTVFAKYPPRLPHEDALWDIQTAGHDLLNAHYFQQYEVSAYARKQQFSEHNMNYWQFGDYLGIGAGAHSKLTDPRTQTVTRLQKARSPKDYMQNPQAVSPRVLSNDDLFLEFLMNALRLKQGTELDMFAARTGLDKNHISQKLQIAIKRGFIDNAPGLLKATAQGQRFLNDTLALFID